MTVHVNGPTNIEIESLGNLNIYEVFSVFSDPKVNRVYIYLNEKGSEIQCLRLSPTVGRAILDSDLPVRRVNLDIDWSYQ